MYTVFFTCGNYGNSLSHFFDKNFVKATFLLNKLLKRWFDEFFLVRENFPFFHTVLCKLRNYSLMLFWQKFRESNVFNEKVTKVLFSRNIFSARVNFSNFHAIYPIFFSIETLSFSNWSSSSHANKNLLCYFTNIEVSDCHSVENFWIFLSLRFYVKSHKNIH